MPKWAGCGVDTLTDRAVPARGAHVLGAFAESLQSAAPRAAVLWGFDGSTVTCTGTAFTAVYKLPSYGYYSVPPYRTVPPTPRNNCKGPAVVCLAERAPNCEL